MYPGYLIQSKLMRRSASFAKKLVMLFCTASSVICTPLPPRTLAAKQGTRSRCDFAEIKVCLEGLPVRRTRLPRPPVPGACLRQVRVRIEWPGDGPRPAFIWGRTGARRAGAAPPIARDVICRSIIKDKLRWRPVLAVMAETPAALLN